MPGAEPLFGRRSGPSRAASESGRMRVISIESLSKHYHEPVLVEATHIFPSGSVTFVMGPNGAGKTTLFKCLLGLEGYSGTILFDGLPLRSVRHDVVPILDDTPFYPALSGRRNLDLLLGRRVDPQEADHAWGLGGRVDPRLLDRPVKGYSSGERKRLAICMALVSKARYLLMDEVASGLDLFTMDAVVAAIQLLAPDTTVVASGHQFDFYARVVDHVVALTDGTLRSVDLDDTSAVSLEATFRSLVAPHSG